MRQLLIDIIRGLSSKIRVLRHLCLSLLASDDLREPNDRYRWDVVISGTTIEGRLTCNIMILS